jgi:hypothetical protein
LLIEALRPVVVHTREKTIYLTPGRPVNFSESDARRLLDRAPGKVRVVTSGVGAKSIRPGMWVVWQSSALPACRGEVLALREDGTFEVFHPLTERLCRLPVLWITQVFEKDEQ